MSTVLDNDTTTTTGSDVDTLFDEIVKNEEKVQDDDSGDHERLAHYVSKEDIVRSSTTGVPVYALCGKKWTPSKNPENYPVCPECKDKWEALKQD